MNFELYQRFLSAKNRGLKSEAREAISQFIASFSSFDEKRAWTKQFLESEIFGHKIRHELYEQIVFPVLLDGYRKRDTWSILWLARTSQNFYASEKLFAALNFKTALALLQEAHEIAVNSPQLTAPEATSFQAQALEVAEAARQELLDAQIRWFDYSQHEWPEGILWGKDVSTRLECDEILAILSATRDLDTENLHANYFDEFEDKVRQFLEKLRRSGQD